MKEFEIKIKVSLNDDDLNELLEEGKTFRQTIDEIVEEMNDAEDATKITIMEFTEL